MPGFKKKLYRSNNSYIETIVKGSDVLKYIFVIELHTNYLLLLFKAK